MKNFEINDFWCKVIAIVLSIAIIGGGWLTMDCHAESNYVDPSDIMVEDAVNEMWELFESIEKIYEVELSTETEAELGE